MFRNIINHKTKSNQFEIEVLTGTISLIEIKSNYKYFSELCKSGCKNYDKKYSCPPLSKDFRLLSEKFNYCTVNILKVSLDNYKKGYNTIRMSNVVLKSIQRKLFDSFVMKNNTFEILLLENGSCRLCKKCNFNFKLPCKHPDKMRYSLEATGIDVNDLIKKCFGFELQWYKKDNFPKYQCVVGGILTNNKEDEFKFSEIINDLQKFKF